RQLIRRFEDQGESALNYDRMTFADLADYYKKRYAVPAQYVNGQKVSGLRTYKDIQQQLSVLKDYFGKARLRAMTNGDIQKFRSDRLATPTRSGKQRTIARVNRELALLRRVLNIANAEGWIIRSPFRGGDTLVSTAAEVKRERIITRAEEDQLLAQCIGPYKNLLPILICALDTGMRQGEILKLIWDDIDFTNRIITVRAFNTKTMRERQVAMTARLEQELLQLYSEGKSKNSLVFGTENNLRKRFNTVRKDAGLPDVRFHDLRHTAATRMVSQHLPLSEVGRVLGHTQPSTTYRYVNANIETARRAAQALDNYHAEEAEKKDKEQERIN
ncbi:MAG: site-specific integrase, partial [Acidobacteriota bacterium]